MRNTKGSDSIQGTGLIEKKYKLKNGEFQISGCVDTPSKDDIQSGKYEVKYKAQENR